MESQKLDETQSHGENQSQTKSLNHSPAAQNGDQSDSPYNNINKIKQKEEEEEAQISRSSLIASFRGRGFCLKIRALTTILRYSFSIFYNEKVFANNLTEAMIDLTLS